MNPVIPVLFSIGILAGLALVYVYRERPERVQRAIDFGAPQDVIGRQRTLLRTMRIFGWWIVAIGVMGLVAIFLVIR
jgi:hypothetical protein